METQENREKRTGIDRRRGSRDQLTTLVRTRTDTLALLSNIIAQRPFPKGAPPKADVEHFCEALIDYTASAHFQLYRFLADNQERRRAVRDVADAVYPRILETTDRILDFNDKYADVSNGDLPELEADLSALGEVLAERIQLEDQVIEALRHERRGR